MSSNDVTSILFRERSRKGRRRSLDARQEVRRRFLSRLLGMTLILAATIASKGLAVPGWIAGPLPPVGLSPRGGHDAAFDEARGVVVLFGGWLDGPLGNDTWEFDGIRWTAGPSAPVGLDERFFHRMAYDSNRGLVVLTGA